MHQGGPAGVLHIPQPLHQLWGHQMDEDWQTDVIRMSTHKKLCYLLTLVATFAGWAETFPHLQGNGRCGTQALHEYSFLGLASHTPSRPTMVQPSIPRWWSLSLKLWASPETSYSVQSTGIGKGYRARGHIKQLTELVLSVFSPPPPPSLSFLCKPLGWLHSWWYPCQSLLRASL